MITPRCLASDNRRLRRCRTAGKKPAIGFTLRWHFLGFRLAGSDLRIGPKAYRKFKDNFAMF